ncbi:hypothetical protein B9Z19DRAFT_1126198 [Tuber borchii]|uniref:Uncharacterized protein n=1 Tax=Tuber borchii TaxID=42251 RepID=A0A2T6ZTE6_TUBBO|nr:hypothetical protein B9Z19DRAFT_1126198 [Tuber borchii]
MVNRGSSSFSASSVAQSGVVLTKSVEKIFALEAEVSRLWHYVSVLSRRLHLLLKESERSGPPVVPCHSRPPSLAVTDNSPPPLVDEEVAGSVAEDVARSVVSWRSVASPPVMVRVPDSPWESLPFESSDSSVVGPVSSGDSDVVLGGMIVASDSARSMRVRRPGKRACSPISEELDGGGDPVVPTVVSSPSGLQGERVGAVVPSLASIAAHTSWLEARLASPGVVADGRSSELVVWGIRYLVGQRVFDHHLCPRAAAWDNFGGCLIDGCGFRPVGYDRVAADWHSLYEEAG